MAIFFPGMGLEFKVFTIDTRMIRDNVPQISTANRKCLPLTASKGIAS